jgi:uncharacterized protein YndB with AHSA1/START domain
MMATLSQTLNRSVIIRASRSTVFRHFTDSARWAAWWGAGSTIDPRPGGRVYVRYVDGTEASGEVVEIDPPRRLVFTYGYASGKPFGPGGSRVAIDLAQHADGTRLTLTHDLPDAASLDEHVQGWRYQLSVFANVAADEANAAISDAIDAWFATWSITDASERAAAFARIAADSVRFGDRFSCIDGIAELVPHVGAAQHFMRGIALVRKGAVRHCQGTALAEWTATAPDGQVRGAGTSVFIVGADGRFQAVTGFWN